MYLYWKRPHYYFVRLQGATIVARSCAQNYNVYKRKQGTKQCGLVQTEPNIGPTEIVLTGRE